MRSSHTIQLLLMLSVSMSFLLMAECRPRFEVIGPVVTLTMKENVEGLSGGSNLPAATEVTTISEKRSSKFSTAQTSATAWMKDISSLRPQALWSIQTLPSPLPNWLPALKQFKADFGYEYHRKKYAPTWLEMTAKFSTQVGDMYLQPCLDFCQEHASELRLQFVRGTSYVRAHLWGEPSTSPTHTILKQMTGSFFFNLPYSAVRTLRLTPLLDLRKSYPDFSCVVEATTGGLGRTKAILNLEYTNPTLAVVHQLDERNTVSPEISIYNARITYQWDYKLSTDGQSFVRTKVDPLEAIYVTWTDESAQGGSWVTDIRLPLEGLTVQALAADVRIKRQFQF